MKKVKKLIAEYQRKIEDCDDDIEHKTSKIRAARRHDPYTDLPHLYSERSLVRSQRQLYIQFIKDLEDLI